jgi:carbamoyltransferase
LDCPNQWSASRFGELAAIAQKIQSDLEDCSTALCASLRQATQARRLALTGGVALNSVMNSRIRKESGFSEVYVPSAPGDEGIALGCALYGLQVRRFQTLSSSLL